MPGGCDSLVPEWSISRFVSPFVRAKRRSVSGLSSAYRAMSFAFLAGVAALEAREVANKLNRPGPDAPDANHKDHDADSAGPSSGLEQATEAQDGRQLTGTFSDRHVEVEATAPVTPQTDASPGRDPSQSPDYYRWIVNCTADYCRATPCQIRDQCNERWHAARLRIRHQSE